MNLKHTPAPWTYHHEPTLNRHTVRAGFAGQINICTSFGSGLKVYETEANARLMAAAPDLLAALGEALEYAERFAEMAGEPDNGDCRRSISAGHAAIAKATGDAPAGADNDRPWTVVMQSMDGVGYALTERVRAASPAAAYETALRILHAETDDSEPFDFEEERRYRPVLAVFAGHHDSFGSGWKY